MSSEEHRQEHRLFIFEPFRLDVRNAQLWREQEVIRLTSKALAVLRYLAERSGQLVIRSLDNADGSHRGGLRCSTSELHSFFFRRTLATLLVCRYSTGRQESLWRPRR